MTEIFVSYASTDRPRVEPLVRAIEAQGFDLWWDRDIPRGQSFNRVIEDALRQARCAIVVWSRASVASEWVFNEASDARKRQILVPVLIDEVEPPLEFRHLQAAKLIDWRGDQADREWVALLDAVRALTRRAPDARAVPPPPRPHWWRTPAGVAVGAGAVLAGLAVLLFALKAVGLLGGPVRPPATAMAPSPVQSPAASPATALAPSPAQSPAASPATAMAPSPAQAPAASPAAAAGSPAGAPPAPGGAGPGRTNLLDPEEGGKLVIASEDNWRQPMARKLQTTVIGMHGFAVFAFRDEKPAVVDTVAVYVESTSGYNLKELAVYAADQAETGPFRRVTVLTVPNYRNMRAPLHEFKVDPFTARYVKVEILSWQDPAGMPNGYVGNLQLLGTLR